MKKSLSVFAVATLALAIAGCGGGGGGASGAATPTDSIGRTMVGYVWVKDNAGLATGPDIVITGSTTPPTGYFAPTAGTISLHVDDGTLIGRAPDDYVRNMADGNDIIVAAKSVEPYHVEITAAGLELSGTPKPNFGNSSATYTEDLAVGGPDGSTMAMASPGSPSYTPGAPATVTIKVNNAAPPTEFVSGGTYSMGVAFFDVNGVAISGLTPTVTSDDAARLAVSGSFDLTPAASSSALAPGPVTIRAALSTDNSLSADFQATFTYGNATSIDVAPGGPTDLLWAEAGAPATVNVTATVLNQFNAPMYNEAVAWTNAKAPGNTWDTATGGACFSAAAGNSDASGQVVVTISAPISAPGPLVGADKNPKGLNTVSVAAGSANGSAQVNITRPIGSLVINGPSRMDVGTTSAASGPDSFRVTDAQDVDNDSIAVPGSITWNLTNVAGSGNVGNTGDGTPQSTSQSLINGSGVVTAGNVAGQVQIEAMGGGVSSNQLVVDIYGVPAKVLFNPDTAATAIPGAAGEYASLPGLTTAFTLTMIDSWGHTVGFGEMSSFSTVSSTDSLSGANITPGGLGVSSFSVTMGSGDGTFAIAASGSWTGAAGGSPIPFSITRMTGLNP
ncbi:MAG TPA: hypothetical protein PLX06_00700 [Fimbriimonadaceae bacterium]|nr:hypothetical protein [Fimbriimonadaceae bacterium]